MGTLGKPKATMVVVIGEAIATVELYQKGNNAALAYHWDGNKPTLEDIRAAERVVHGVVARLYDPNTVIVNNTAGKPVELRITEEWRTEVERMLARNAGDVRDDEVPS